ncbi:hypothetical protein E4U03_12385 [Rothia nasimurium]|uniref:Uncharacterized protein n=1 Tax=Rothia nasimurium TaxID=85336 RepID=A0A4Y9F073_9MICC|nr:hypothetical protein [Rothia nasimurium]MBF0809394.1 hypothetical protein [Rothia nasimurium]TFU19446.1 hypothetical protein E4U03_12385 [Rothia nasimurium]
MPHLYQATALLQANSSHPADTPFGAIAFLLFFFIAFALMIRPILRLVKKGITLFIGVFIIVGFMALIAPLT